MDEVDPVNTEAPATAPVRAARDPQVTQRQAPGDGGPPGHRSAMAGLVRDLIVDVTLPVATYYVLAGLGVADVWALLASGVWPAGNSIRSLIRQRHVDELGVFILTLIILGILTSLLFRDVRLLLIKDSAFTGTLGLVYLTTLLMRRPLTFYFGRKFVTDDSAAARASWDEYWNELSVFRHGQRVLTTVWGVTLLIEALIRIPATLILPLSVMVAVSNIMPFAVITALIFWTISYGRRNAVLCRAQAAELDHARLAEPGSAESTVA